jgi:hypothetical protein
MIATPPPPDGVILSFSAPCPPDDVPRFTEMATDLKDRLSHLRHFGGIDTLPLWNQPAETARAFQAALDCMAEAGDVEPDWAAADEDYPISRIQGWAAIHKPGVIVCELAYELAADWYPTHGAVFERPERDIHGDHLLPAGIAGRALASQIAEAEAFSGKVVQLPISQEEATASQVWWNALPPADRAKLRESLRLAEGHSATPAKPKQELIVDLVERLRADPAAPEFDWGDRVPRGEVTLLGAHGGTGKSTWGLMLAACAAAGRDFLGLSARHQVAGFYSGEDNEGILLHRLGKICRAQDIDPAELEGRLHMFDVTGADPVLYRQSQPTPRLDWLRKQVQTLGIGLLIVDGASDTFDDNEISRARVREFMRLLRGLGCTVILLAHIDKQAAKGNGGDQNYSGSTAWNNSARSRLAMLPNTDGTMELVHEKSNHGPKQSPIRLMWCAGLPALASAGAATGQNPTRALLELIAEFNTRGEHIGTGNTSSTNAFRMLAKEPTFPKGLSRADVFYQLRQAERAGYLSNFEYKTQDRKTRKRWELTETGKALIAPTVAPASQG